nr:uncharacterized protein LOC106681054 [Halyomorpha halys]
MLGQEEINFLGHSISREGIKPHVRYKVEALKNMLVTRDVKGIQRLMGALNYYRRFVPEMADHMVPLNNFLKKGSIFGCDFRPEYFCENMRRGAYHNTGYGQRGQGRYQPRYQDHFDDQYHEEPREENFGKRGGKLGSKSHQKHSHQRMEAKREELSTEFQNTEHAKIREELLAGLTASELKKN